MIHRHVWQVANRAEQPSGLDQLHRAGLRELQGLPPDLFKRAVIVTYRCVTCGTEKIERV